jgi:hypothetical protein
MFKEAMDITDSYNTQSQDYHKKFPTDYSSPSNTKQEGKK